MLLRARSCPGELAIGAAEAEAGDEQPAFPSVVEDEFKNFVHRRRLAIWKYETTRPSRDATALSHPVDALNPGDGNALADERPEKF